MKKLSWLALKVSVTKYHHLITNECTTYMLKIFNGRKIKLLFFYVLINA